jgi:hypothetical protein
MMSRIARVTGQFAVPARTEAPPKRESKPAKVATLAIIVTPIGRLGFDSTDAMFVDSEVEK